MGRLKNLMKNLEEKNKKISALENHNTRLELIEDHATEVGKKLSDKNNQSKKTESCPAANETKKCIFENKSSCKMRDQCQFFHPSGTCQQFSKFSTCRNEQSCIQRHPSRNCFNFESSGYCRYGDNCRFRHPVSFSNNTFLGHRSKYNHRRNQQQIHRTDYYPNTSENHRNHQQYSQTEHLYPETR